MTIPLSDDDSGRITTKAFDTIAEKMKRATCVAIGPGMGRSRDLQILLGQILRIASCPVVIDADGLNNLARSTHGSFELVVPP